MATKPEVKECGIITNAATNIDKIPLKNEDQQKKYEGMKEHQ